MCSKANKKAQKLSPLVEMAGNWPGESIHFNVCCKPYIVFGNME